MNREIVAMPSIELKLDKTSFGSAAHFTGVVEPVGSAGYKFSGTLKATCVLDRGNAGFANTVRIGHGGVSGKYEHLDLELVRSGENSLKIEGEGKRAANEKVEFYVAVNEGISGQYKESPEVTCDLGVVADESTSSTPSTLADSQEAFIFDMKKSLPPEFLKKHAQVIERYEQDLRQLGPQDE